MAELQLVMGHLPQLQTPKDQETGQVDRAAMVTATATATTAPTRKR